MRKRLPAFETIRALFSLILFWVYSWTFFTFFWKIPSWMFFLTIGEIGVNFAYAMSVALLESGFWLLIFLVLTIILPPKLLSDYFLARAGWFFVGFYGILTLFLIPSVELKQSLSSINALWLAIACGSIFMLLASRFALLGKWMDALTERLNIFLFLYLPLSLISIISLLIRYLFLE